MMIEIMDWIRTVSGQTWAAWVQGVGTLIGIFIAWRIGRAESLRVKKKEHEHEIDSIRSVCHVIFRAGDIIKAASEMHIEIRTGDAVIRSLGVIAGMLENLTLISRPTSVMVKLSLSSANEINRFLQMDQQKISMSPVIYEKKSQDVSERLESNARLLLSHYGIQEDEIEPERVKAKSTSLDNLVARMRAWRTQR